MAGSGQELRRLGVVALVQMVPATITAAFWSGVRHHPVLATAGLAAFEVLVAAGLFVADVAMELRGRWVPKAADAVDGIMRRMWLHVRPQYETHYRAHLQECCKFVDLRGLRITSGYAPHLADVFVDVSLVPGPLHDATRVPLAGTPYEGHDRTRHSIRDFLAGSDSKCLAVIGAPGTGKTTLLKHLALDTSRSRRRNVRDLPVLVYLRDHAEAVTRGEILTLADMVRASVGTLDVPEPQGWLEAQLKHGRCLVLLDGLDEVPTEIDRRMLSRWLENQVERYAANHFVLTSRPHGYASAPLNRARVLRVRRFTGDQISKFVHQWYAATERWDADVLNPPGTVPARARLRADDLLERLGARPMLHELASNPLLLTMIANVHRYRGVLPGSRAELYEQICEVLLWGRAKAKATVERGGEPLTEAEGRRNEGVLVNDHVIPRVRRHVIPQVLALFMST